MSYGFEMFKADGSLQFSSNDRTFVLIDTFDINSTETGSRNYPGYSNARVFVAASVNEGPYTQLYCPDLTFFGVGHRITVSGNSSQATVTWDYATSVFYSGGTSGTTTIQPRAGSTLYVYAI
jgi:hypothetical protein